LVCLITYADAQSLSSDELFKQARQSAFDGKDYPLVGDPTADSRAYRKQGARTLLMTVKKDGKVTINGRIVVTANGKSRTVTTYGTDANGKRFRTTAVYDKA